MVQKFFKKCIGSETSPRRLALSFSLGTYIAFSPFLGLHTLMVLILGWLSRLNIPVAMTAAYVVNNPWTMIPIYSAGYALGYFLLHKATSLGTLLTNPTWMHNVDNFFNQYLHMSQPCLWSFFIGGNLLGIFVAILAYPFTKPMFAKLISMNNHKV
jgi:uncharacterized protein